MKKDKFYVVKPIGSHDTQTDQNEDFYNPDPNLKIRKKFIA
jgi:hypothetical protein